eukprot:2934647-Rhodomonas_salina.1
MAAWPPVPAEMGAACAWMLPQARFESGREEIEDVTVCVRWARMKGEEGTAGERKGLVEQSSEGRNNGGEGKEGIARRHGQS